MAEPGAASTRERILLAAIECMEGQGVEGVTVRGIAAAAGVNVAAISYHYGGKGALMEEALERTLHNAFSLEELDGLLADGFGLRQALGAYLVQFLEDALKWPGLMEAHLHDPLTRREYPERLVRRMDEMLKRFAGVVAPLMEGVGEAARLRSAVQFWSAVLLPVLLPGLFVGAGVDLKEESGRRVYVSSLLDRFFSGSTAGGG
ncbi:MAG TPA: TetR/AcrR family transcriptional regulator [Longimicrobiales bacterium]|nr:TetR/AcrR family transcriptional regulator [Longimicrobiales bacterium]